MAKALEFQGMSLENINQANEALKASLENADPAVQLSIANSLWAKQGIDFNPDFLQRNQQFYKAKVTALNFASSNAKSTINNWVKETTYGKIDKIIEHIETTHVLFLINAIYFKGNWINKFDKSQTTERPFYLSNGNQKQHPMMSQWNKYKYFENDTFQAISLPYGKGRLNFYVFLPKKNTSLEAFQQQLSIKNWQKWMRKFRRRDGLVQLPRFKFDYDIQLNDALKALGMEPAFNEAKANFSRMTSEPVNINTVKHKTFIEVNEEGTEAAAVTSVNVFRSVQMQFQMVVDHPFFCAIRDNQTGTILLMGSVREPK